ncbi:hypothetical protein CENSYa_1638 [Cenarchaeum symbiosum A]|uniref:Uncharacterized protein n=1 Tax=Cenarchaeum symbiosum (strain A) TaxID=414004 RepID=A0RY39_CENSY|nr:hypothetical protein CENSYa_1638 [Cenarchaeum symbiosum A]
MLAYAGLVGATILGMLALIPAGSDETGMQFYGMAEVVQKGASGETLSSQTVHNRLLDSGEDYIIKSVFKTGERSVDDTRVDSMCLYAQRAFDALTEGEITTRLTPFNVDGNCVADSNIEYDSGTGIVEMKGTWITGVNTIDELVTEPGRGSSLGGLVICSIPDPEENDKHCNNPDRAMQFAAVPLEGVDLSEGGVLDVTYTFNIATPDT